MNLIKTMSPLLACLPLCTQADSRPNVLMIIVDDLRPAAGCYGGGAITPFMDSLAANGIRYTNAHAQYPQCMPSRVSFLTGKRVPAFIGTTTSKNFRKEGEPTLPEWFREHGYRTLSLGKVYHSFDDNKEAWDVLEKVCQNNPYRLEENRRKQVVKNGTKFGKFAENLEKFPPHTEATDQPGSSYQDGEIAAGAIARLKQEAATEQPFFMAVGFHRPHLPWTAPQECWDLYDRSKLKLPDNAAFPGNGISRSNLLDFMHYSDPAVLEAFSGNLSNLYPNMDDFPVLPEADWKKYIHAYLASTSHVDAQIGSLLDELKSLDLTDNTVIILLSDHGFHLGEHKLWAKVTNYDESSRVPLLLAGPGVSPAVIEQPVELVDVYPTLCKLAGIGLPAHLHGTPLPLTPAQADPNAAAFAANGGAHSIITDRYRLNYYGYRKPNPNSPADGNIELYDHKNDPGELSNVAHQKEYLEIQESLLARLFEAAGLDIKR